MILLAGLAACLAYGAVLDPIYPIADWLFWSVAAMWGWDLFLSASCVSFGYLLLRRGLRLTALPRLETLSLSMTLGAIAFVMGMYVGGFAGWYGPTFAVAMPGILLLAGLPHARARLPFVIEGMRGGGSSGFGPWALLASVFGTLCLGLLYLGALTPNAVNYDATWNHLVIAQDYARNGRIVPFPADWVKNVPHLGSIVNTWAFLVPGFRAPAQRYMMALHDEFTFFVWTLVGVAAMVRWVTDRQGVRGTWAAYFLFPSIFVYDGNLGTAADHFLAFFAAPLFLACVRTLRRFEIGACCLTGAIAAGALLTKLHAVYLLVPIGMVLGTRLGYLIVQARGAGGGARITRLIEGALALGATTVAVASPHFVANAVFYKNPFYPLFQDVFTSSTPGVPGAATQMRYLFVAWGWHPPKELWPRVKTTIELVFTIPFRPLYGYLGSRPTFGGLFSLSLAMLPFLGRERSRRLWLAVGVCLGALATWAFTFRVDRNLQTFLPVLVATTAAILIRAWETGLLARIGVSALVLLQVIWGGDLYFSGNDRIADSIALIRSGLDGQASTRFDGARRDYVALGKVLPKDAVVLMHNWHPMLGIDRTVLLDWIGFQGLIDYRTFKTPRDLYLRFREVGVTHVVYLPGLGRAPASKQEQILFDTFASFHGAAFRDFGELRMFPMPAEPPAPHQPFRVAVRGMNGYSDGVYPIESLSVCEEMPPDLQIFPGPATPIADEAGFTRLLAGVDAALIGASSRASSPLPLDQFVRVGGRSTFDIYARRELPRAAGSTLSPSVDSGGRSLPRTRLLTPRQPP